MGRIWNALRYGDSETRRCIGSVILFIVLGIVFIVAGGLSGKIILFVVGMLFGVVALVISQTFTLVDDDFVAEVGKDGTKDTVSTVTVKRNGVVSSSKPKETSKKDEDTEDDDNAGSKDKDKKKDKEHTDVDRFAKYNKQVLKKVKRKYRVRKDHRPIIIDSSESYKIRECPAFIWRVHNKVYLLLLEKEPRKLCISRDMIHHIGYRPGVKVEKDKEYPAFKKENLITNVFSDYLPDYFPSKERNDPRMTKNLYVIGNDICVTNKSVADIIDLLYLNFMPDDKITKSDKVNGYFKRIYAANIMFKDHVNTIGDYKEAVEKVLGEMAYAQMPKREYDETLEKLVKGHLISQEYADYYEEHRMFKG